MRQAVFVVMLVAVGLAGCSFSGDSGRTSDATHDEDSLALDSDSGFTLDVPVDVVLIGFENGTAKSLHGALTTETAHHAWHSYDRFQNWSRVVLPYIFEANYTVHDMGTAFTEAFWDHVSQNQVEAAEPDVFDANAAETYLADHLPAAGVELDPNRVTLVMLHANGALPENHAWQIAFEYGSLEPVRHFGERTPLVIHDMSARPDPYVGAPGANVFTPERALEEEPRPYNVQTAAGGTDTVDTLELYVRDATHHRVLQGPTYPPSTRPCHDVSILMAVDSATLSGKAPGWQVPEDWLNHDLLEATFKNLTRDDVRVTVQWLMLPQDDVGFAARVRATSNLVPTWDPMYTYLQDHWRRFTDVRAGCEGYLSVVYFGDMVGGVHGNGGFAMYDADNQRRISYSVRQDMARLLDDIDTATETVVDQGLFASPRIDNVVSHETGHLFGLLHPQNARFSDGGHVMNAVESAHSVMSYQPIDVTDEFGTVDEITWLRNRAAHAVWRAQVLDLEETTAFEEGIKALKTYEWRRVQEALEPHIQAAEDQVIPADSDADAAPEHLAEKTVQQVFFASDHEVQGAMGEVDP